MIDFFFIIIISVGRDGNGVSRELSTTKLSATKHQLLNIMKFEGIFKNANKELGKIFATVWKSRTGKEWEDTERNRWKFVFGYAGIMAAESSEDAQYLFLNHDICKWTIGMLLKSIECFNRDMIPNIEGYNYVAKIQEKTRSKDILNITYEDTVEFRQKMLELFPKDSEMYKIVQKCEMIPYL